MDCVIVHAKVFHRGRFLDDYGVAIKGRHIVWVAPSADLKDLPASHRIDFQGDYLVPGYIDLHIHGLGNRLMDNGREDIEAISRALPTFGTTSFLATIIPHPPAEEATFLRSIAKAESPGANILGFFLEGPFLAKTGAIRAEALADRTPERVDMITSSLAPHRVVFAISPELSGLPEVMSLMKAPIFITHTQAGVKDTLKAIEMGACHATHFYDVFHMPLETDPGVRPCGAVEAILADPKVSVDFILDGEHVDPVAVRMALACKPVDKVCLITDSNIGAGLCPGTYRGIGDDEIRFAYPGSPARGTENSRYPGALYGSGLTLDRAVRNVVAFKVGSLETAITMASTSPAKVMGVYGQKGDIDKGFDADLLRLSSDLEVITAWVGGKTIERPS
jgi:N-acetylglucosamine-6-phosphate deacetylase